MSKLKPIGSEKLQGMEKIHRMLEIAKYNENIPQPVNETSKDTFSFKSVDGVKYDIVKEKLGYVIKQEINESVDYLEPMKNRTYFRSYSQAMKKLNLIIKESNRLAGFDGETPLLGEQKKFVLKTPKPKLELPAELRAEAKEEKDALLEKLRDMLEKTLRYRKPYSKH